ncbi:lytic transglycosylase domain-containing protein [Sphingomonas sp. ID1715]|nr:lytic transglycosylase domain-containing protein [Sphingomonas sp. ID1715]
MSAALASSVPVLGAPGREQPEGAAFLLLEHRQEAVVTLPRSEQSFSVAPKAGTPSGLHRRRSVARRQMLPAIRAAEVRHRLPIGLFDALIATESAYSPWAVSRAGAAGLAQLMPATAAEMGIVNRLDPLQSIEGGARYLRRMLDRFGSISLALAAYNAGPGSVLRAGGIPYNGETASYVARVLRRWTSLPLD